MTGSTDYQQWLRAGQPAQTAQPIIDLCATLHRHGYNVGRLDHPGLGDTAHLTDLTPEDHTPFSHSGWPVNPTPRWWITALDLMRTTDRLEVPVGKPSITTVMAKIRADKIAGRRELVWLKFINWTDGAGNCWHDSWQPGYTRRPSTDRGHGHLSCRSDYLTSTAASGYDPITELMTTGGDMYEQYDRDLLQANLDTSTRTGAAVTALGVAMDALEAAQGVSKAALDALVVLVAAGGGSVEGAAIEAVRADLHTAAASVDALRQQVADLHTELAAAAHADATAIQPPPPPT